MAFQRYDDLIQGDMDILQFYHSDLIEAEIQFLQFYPTDLIQAEIEFLQFYHFLIVDDLQITDLEFNLWYLDRVKKAYSKTSLNNAVSTIYFDNPAIRTAYIYKRVPCVAGNIFYHFVSLVHNNCWLLERAVHQQSLTITCLGGGPAAEIVAIAKALDLIFKSLELNVKPVMIHAYIVDVDPGWKETVNLITQKWWKFFDGKYFRLNLTFVQYDLTESFSGNIRDIVKGSDVITMCHFVSAVYGAECREKIPKMMQEIINHMDENGIIFYVNCSRFSCVKELRDIIANSANTEVIYGPIYNHVYQLSDPCQGECYRLYGQYFADYAPTTQAKNHVVAWRKVEKHEGSKA